MIFGKDVLLILNIVKHQLHVCLEPEEPLAEVDLLLDGDDHHPHPEHGAEQEAAQGRHRGPLPRQQGGEGGVEELLRLDDHAALVLCNKYNVFKDLTSSFFLTSTFLMIVWRSRSVPQEAPHEGFPVHIGGQQPQAGEALPGLGAGGGGLPVPEEEVLALPHHGLGLGLLELVQEVSHRGDQQRGRGQPLLAVHTHQTHLQIASR